MFSKHQIQRIFSDRRKIARVNPIFKIRLLPSKKVVFVIVIDSPLKW